MIQLLFYSYVEKRDEKKWGNWMNESKRCRLLPEFNLRNNQVIVKYSLQ